MSASEDEILPTMENQPIMPEYRNINDDDDDDDDEEKEEDKEEEEEMDALSHVDDQETYEFVLRGNLTFTIKRRMLKIVFTVVTVVTNLMLIVSSPILLGPKG